MHGYFEYFPWEVAYESAPWFGRRRSLCADVEKAPPPVIAYEGSSVWGYRLEDYAPCLFRILAAEYRQSEIDPRLYIRADRFNRPAAHRGGVENGAQVGQASAAPR